MKRYVAIDNNSGYIFFDDVSSSPIDLVWNGEKNLGEDVNSKTYSSLGPYDPNDSRYGYYVFEVPVEMDKTEDGQDMWQIRKVYRDGTLVDFIEVKRGYHECRRARL